VRASLAHKCLVALGRFWYLLSNIFGAGGGSRPPSGTLLVTFTTLSRLFAFVCISCSKRMEKSIKVDAFSPLRLHSFASSCFLGQFLVAFCHPFHGLRGVCDLIAF
jgi:hypothetical protein